MEAKDHIRFLFATIAACILADDSGASKLTDKGITSGLPILYLLCDRLNLARFFTCHFLQATNSVPMKSLRPLEQAGWDRCIVPEMPFKSGRRDQSFWRAVQRALRE
jgi:hypothetical protein